MTSREIAREESRSGAARTRFARTRSDRVALERSGAATATVLAGCRTSWRGPLSREVHWALGASVYVFDEALEVACAACDLLARGETIHLVILEVAQQAALGFIHEVAPEVPVVLVGNGNDLEARIRAATCGAAAFLAEPVTIREIVRIAKAIAGRATAPAVPARLPIPFDFVRGGGR